MLVDTMIESHLYGYLSTGNEFHCVIVITIDFMLEDKMFESYLYKYLSTGNGFHCVMVIAIDFMLIDTIVSFFLSFFFPFMMHSTFFFSQVM